LMNWENSVTGRVLSLER